MIAMGAFTVALLAATFLVALGLGCFVRPETTRRFLGAFASTARLHFVEVALRLIAGTALVESAPDVQLGRAVAVFGWMILGTSLVLAVVPWRLHQRFAELVMPHVLGRLRVIGLVSAVGGLALLGVLVPSRLTV
jgi:hypothetical protein